MIIASFDIGIKNMAYCILDISSNDPIIKDWNVVNLISDNNSTFHNCNQICKNNKICGKKAKFTKNNNYYCNTHSKNSGFLIPTKNTTLPYLKKQNKETIINISKSLFINPIGNKDEIIKNIFNHYQNNCLITLNNKKIKANDIDLLSIGKSIKHKFDEISIMNNIDVVLIENQISPIANRMKTIQGMLAQYFIMKYDEIKIEFISSSGKLKGLSKENENLDSNYKQNKKDAVFHCNQYLEKDIYKEWKYVLNTDKKDDLADCFLQGIFWINKKIKY
jgi:hypothetical protein